MLVYGSMSVSSCRCCMFVSSVHPVALLNAAFCMTFRLLLVEDAIGIFQSWFHDCLVVCHECSLCLHPAVAVSVFIICRGLCACAEML